jgi:divalent metal cation (Fe/Co/Zn/Cd) transporter
LTHPSAVALQLFQVNGSALILCFGLENCVDFLSSAIVLWRFYCPELTPEVEKKLAGREKRASIAISLILMFLGIFIIFAAMDDIEQGVEEEEKLRLVLWVSLTSIFIFGVMCIFKFHYSILLQSASLHKDGICSLIGTILSGALFINTLVIKHFPEVWWIDPAVAVACGIASILIGLYAVCVAMCVKKIPIYSLKWWYWSHGDGTDEITGRELTPVDVQTAPDDKKPEVSEVV